MGARTRRTSDLMRAVLPGVVAPLGECAVVVRILF